MKMVIGGTFQGKKAFAESLCGISVSQMTDGSSCEYDEIFSTPCLVHFHEYVRRMMKDGLDYKAIAAELIRKNPDIVIVTNELGYGVVPIDAFDRRYREDTGRICCELAAFSSEVYRVCCGIAVKIKGDKS